MKEEKILDLIGNIDDRFILEAAPAEKKVRMRVPAGRLAALAASAVLCLTAAYIALTYPEKTDTVGDCAENSETALTGEESGDSGAPVIVYEAAGDSEGSLEESIKSVTITPVYYTSLNMPATEENSVVISQAGGASSMIDVTSFDESVLSRDKCCYIVEGDVVDLYVKYYNYDIYDDKFGENEIMHSSASTVVYEVAVNKTWYGDDVSGGTILVEDALFYADPVLSVRKGGRYVLPVYEYGDVIWTDIHEYAGGDITRDSLYSTVYPYHPQISVTTDGFYLVPKEWKTLTAVNSREVIMDTLDEDNFYYKGEMCLVDADTFAVQMAALASSIE